MNSTIATLVSTVEALRQDVLNQAATIAGLSSTIVRLENTVEEQGTEIRNLTERGQAARPPFLSGTLREYSSEVSPSVADRSRTHRTVLERGLCPAPVKVPRRTVDGCPAGPIRAAGPCLIQTG